MEEYGSCNNTRRDKKLLDSQKKLEQPEEERMIFIQHNKPSGVSTNYYFIHPLVTRKY